MTKADIKVILETEHAKYKRLKEKYDKLVIEAEKLLDNYNYIEKQNYELRQELQQQGLKLYKLEKIINDK